MATLLSVLYLKYRYVFMTIAVYVGFSRIYLGMHYPFDVMAGVFLGSVVGILFLWVDRVYYEKVKAKYSFVR